MRINTATKSLFILSLITLLGFGLRLHHLGACSLWGDECFTRVFSGNSLSYLWTQGLRIETNPPLYYSLIHFWMQLFGASEAVLRFPSVLASTATIVIVYGLGKELQSQALGLIAALIIALAPTELWFAQEARPYALMQFFAGLALFAMARFFSRPQSWWNLGIYFLGATFAVYFHNTALLFVAACNLALLGAFWADRSVISPRDLVRWLVVNALVGLAILPLFLNMMAQMGSQSIHWIPKLTPPVFARMLNELFGGIAACIEFHNIHWLFIFLIFLSILLLLALIFLLFRLKKPDLPAISVLILVPVFFFCLAILVGLRQPILISRVLLWTWIPLSLLFAHTLIHAGRFRVPLIVLVAVVFAPGLCAQLFPLFSPKENWKELARQNQEQFANADMIVLDTPGKINCFAVYMPSTLPRLHFIQMKGCLNPMKDNMYSFYRKEFGVSVIGTKDLLDSIKSGRRVLFFCSPDASSINPLEKASLPPDYHFYDISPHYNFFVYSWNNN